MRLTPFLITLLLWPGVAHAQQLDLDGDTDRNGVVSGSQGEEELEGTRSVIVLNNCDADARPASGTPKPDNSDTVINGTADRKDLEPILLRRVTGSLSGQVSLRVKGHSPDGIADEIDEGKRVRIFKSSGVQVIGPNTSTSYLLTGEDINSLRAADMTLLVEGLSFATSVTLSVHLGAVEKDRIILEAAPFLLTPHSQRARKNLVVSTGSTESRRYVSAFGSACRMAGVAPVTLQSGDIWIEDEMSWGYSETPRMVLPVVLHLFRLRELKTSVQKLIAPNIGYATLFDPGASPARTNSLNFGGNLEVTPPTSQYPFGRVYYGSIPSRNEGANSYSGRQIDPGYQRFFQRQRLQPPIDLHTDWLRVGHIDEVVSFVPKSDGKHALLIASPKLALDILREMPPETPLDARYSLLITGLETVGDFFRIGQLNRTLEEYNLEVDTRLFGLDHANPHPESIKGRLKAALGLDERDILEAPVLFFNGDRSGVWGAAALTPGLVNLSSMGRFSLIPEPFLPEFRANFQQSLARIGQEPLFIDDWSLYHAAYGEVHCGSNTLRDPFARKWWQ
jgi:protein-arginine deiminase